MRGRGRRGRQRRDRTWVARGRLKAVKTVGMIFRFLLRSRFSTFRHRTGIERWRRRWLGKICGGTRICRDRRRRRWRSGKIVSQVWKVAPFEPVVDRGRRNRNSDRRRNDFRHRRGRERGRRRGQRWRVWWRHTRLDERGRFLLEMRKKVAGTKSQVRHVQRRHRARNVGYRSWRGRVSLQLFYKIKYILFHIELLKY
jgi:hypothetical protein